MKDQKLRSLEAFLFKQKSNKTNDLIEKRWKLNEHREIFNDRYLNQIQISDL